ncbi:hypothetical protein MD484_g2592, partial [Candolleomyces efflorescens]
MSTCQLGGSCSNPTAAIDYLVAAKAQLSPDVYADFLGSLKDFREGDIDVSSTIARVAKLFEGYPALIEGFNSFVPEGHRIEINILDANEYTVTVTTPAGTQTSDDTQRVRIISATLPAIVKDENSPSERAKEGMSFANQYMAKLTTRYAGNANIAKQFLEILQKYNKDVPDSDKTVQSEMKELLKDEPDLLESFEEFWKAIIAKIAKQNS